MFLDLLEKSSGFITDHIVLRLVMAWVAFFGLQLFGSLEQGHIAVGILLIVDTIAGVWRAAKQGRLHSSKLFLGALRKVCLYGLFLIAIYQLVRISNNLMFLTDWAFLFLAATEALSVIENLHEIGLFIPKWLSGYLHKILEKKPLK